MSLESLESTEDVRVALGCASSNFYPSFVLSNFQRVPYLDVRTLTHEQIVIYVQVRRHFTLKFNMNLSEDKFSRILSGCPPKSGPASLGWPINLPFICCG